MKNEELGMKNGDLRRKNEDGKPWDFAVAP
jgi:hypothetical protein